MQKGMFDLDAVTLMTVRRSGRGDVLCCLSGSVWITYRGCCVDLVLDAGNDFHLWGHRDICIQALSLPGAVIRIGSETARA